MLIAMLGTILELKKWQSRTEEYKKITSHRKAVIQEGFKKQLGLLSDSPKPGYVQIFSVLMNV